MKMCSFRCVEYFHEFAKKAILQLIIRLFLFATAIREHCQLPKSIIVMRCLAKSDEYPTMLTALSRSNSGSKTTLRWCRALRAVASVHTICWRHRCVQLLNWALNRPTCSFTTTFLQRLNGTRGLQYWVGWWRKSAVRLSPRKLGSSSISAIFFHDGSEANDPYCCESYLDGFDGEVSKKPSDKRAKKNNKFEQQ